MNTNVLGPHEHNFSAEALQAVCMKTVCTIGVEQNHSCGKKRVEQLLLFVKFYNYTVSLHLALALHRSRLFLSLDELDLKLNRKLNHKLQVFFFFPEDNLVPFILWRATRVLK